MTTRFTYSRWDGTQKGFEVDAESLLEAVTDDLLYHGDVNSALRRLMQQGLTDRNGERIEGMRDMMNKIRERREELLERSDLGGVYSEISEALDDIIDEERHAIDNARRDAENSGDERRAENEALQTWKDGCRIRTAAEAADVPPPMVFTTVTAPPVPLTVLNVRLLNSLVRL